VAEQPVFWLGGKPGNSKSKERAAPEAERYEAAIRDACESCGYDLDEYVAAQGGFGGWLAHLDRAGSRYRIFWNGKAGRMVFEQAQEHGGWNELAAADASDDGLPAFVAALRQLITGAGARG
jgi:hypothetical protein